MRVEKIDFEISPRVVCYLSPAAYAACGACRVLPYAGLNLLSVFLCFCCCFHFFFFSVPSLDQIMAAERNRDIGSMTMAREMEEKISDLHIQRIQGGCSICGESMNGVAVRSGNGTRLISTCSYNAYCSG